MKHRHQVGASGVCILCGLPPSLWTTPTVAVDVAGIRDRVIRRDRRCLLDHLEWHRCFGPLTVHHLKKRSQGGDWTPSNLVTLCAGGNGWVEDQPRKARGLGLVIAAGVDELEAKRRRKKHGLC